MSGSVARPRWNILLPLLAAVLLTACGEGGGSSSTGTTSTSASTTTPSAGSGTATLSWYAPTTNTDGSALTDLSGYRIYYGTNTNALTQLNSINTVGITTYVITDLGVGTWYFAIKAYNSTGVESDLSNIASKTIS